MLTLRKKRKLYPVKFLVYLILSISMIFYQQFYPDSAGRVFFNWYGSVSIITNLTRKPSFFLSNFLEDSKMYIDAVEQNKKLKKEIIHLKWIEKKAKFLATENKELRYLINMSKLVDEETVVANVYLDSSNLYVNSFLINVGLDDGIAPGLAVLNQEGLVGRVLETGRRFSRVLLINDYNASIPVRILETGVHGMLKGTNNPHNVKLITKEVEDVVKVGQHVVTSSLQGMFDDGIPVGRIGNVTKEKIEVVPYANMTRISKVLIIKRKGVK